VFYIGNVEY